MVTAVQIMFELLVKESDPVNGNQNTPKELINLTYLLQRLKQLT